MGVNSLPKTFTRQRRGCGLNPGPSAPESSTLTTRLPSHRVLVSKLNNLVAYINARLQRYGRQFETRNIGWNRSYKAAIFVLVVDDARAAESRVEVHL